MKNPIKRYTIDTLLALMNPTHQKIAKQILKDYSAHIYVIPGSTKKHHCWKGGYISHLEEAMNIAIILYEELGTRRKLYFSISSMLFIIFIHDFDKVIRYEYKDNDVLVKKGYDKEYIHKTRKILEGHYLYNFTASEWNALLYVHGEGDDYHPTKLIMKPLACLVHCSDIISARLWPKRGRNKKW